MFNPVNVAMCFVRTPEDQSRLSKRTYMKHRAKNSKVSLKGMTHIKFYKNLVKLIVLYHKDCAENPNIFVKT